MGSKPYTPGMDTFYGYIRTSRRAQEGVAGMDPATQELQLRRAGVPRDRIYRDVGVSGATGTNQRRGWHSLDARIAAGDTLVVAAIDRIGRTWMDTIRAIVVLQERGVKIKSLADSEAQWTKYLEAEAGSPEAFIGQILLMFGAWVADRELESIRQRSIEGQNHARAKGQRIGRPPALSPAQVEVVRRQKAAGMTFPELSDVMEVSESTLKRALRGHR